MIWDYVLGHRRINISYGWDSSSRCYRWMSIVSVPVLYKIGHQGWVLTEPTFSLPRVCRQIYVETSAMIYTLNRFDFSFSGTSMFDSFIRNRVSGQRCLISCIAVPIGFFQFYLRNRRKPFRVTFPNIKRVVVKFNYKSLISTVSRVSEDDVASILEHEPYPSGDPLKIWVKNRVKQKEGREMEIEWC